MTSRLLHRSMLCVALAATVSVLHARSYILTGNGNKLPTKLEASIAAAGGTVTHTLPGIGLAIVESDAPAFAASAGKIAGVDAVLPNVQWRANLPVVAEIAADVEDAAAASHLTLVTDPWAALQWNLEAIAVDGAWSAGHRGAGVRVAVLDSGVASGHIDLAPAMNLPLSTSFVPGEAFNATGAGFNHGTHVAGIIAARANGVGTVGVAPNCEIVAVKVLSAATGSGSFGGIISGIYYAATIGADVANMSLGAAFPRSGFIDDNGTPADTSDDVKVGANEISSLVNAMNRATTYAYQNGVTIITSAGNDAADRDHDANMLHVPSDCTHVLTVSATGPYGWASNPTGSLDYLASYSNYGQSRIDLAAPGGDGIYPGVELRNIGGITQQAWVFDLVFAPSNRIGTSNRYSWSAGTSMAAPHVAGVAALIIGKNGGSMKPQAVMSALKAGVDDLGKPGNDDAYGAGRINAAKAVAP